MTDLVEKILAAFLSFVAEIKLSIFSWLVENFSSHVSLLTAQVYIFKKLFLWSFHLVSTSWFSWICGEKYGQMLKMCGMNLFLLHKLKSGLSLAAPYFWEIHMILFPQIFFYLSKSPHSFSSLVFRTKFWVFKSFHFSKRKLTQRVW